MRILISVFASRTLAFVVHNDFNRKVRKERKESQRVVVEMSHPLRSLCALCVKISSTARRWTKLNANQTMVHIIQKFYLRRTNLR